MTDAQLLAGETDTLDNGLIFPTACFLGAVISGVEFHFDVEAFHIWVCLDYLIRLPHGHIACTGCHTCNATTVLVKDNAMVGEMICKGQGGQLADGSQRVFSNHKRVVGVNTGADIGMIDAIDDPEHFLAKGFGVILQADPDTRILSYMSR